MNKKRHSIRPVPVLEDPNEPAYLLAAMGKDDKDKSKSD